MAPTPPAADVPHGGVAAHIHCNALLSSAFLHLPLSSPRPLWKPSHLNRTTAGDAGPAAASAAASAADRFFKELLNAASEHPFIKPLLSLHSDFRSFVKIRCRASRIPSSLSAHNFAAILPGDSVAALVVANGLSNFLNIYNSLLVVRLVLTWFPNSPPAIVSPLSTLCDPYLNIFRGIIPPLGGTLDLSPILAFLVLNAFTSTASALPAELPIGASPRQGTISPSHPFLNLTTTQKKWMRRLCCKRAKSPQDVE